MRTRRHATSRSSSPTRRSTGLVAQVDARSASARTSVLMADGTTLGSPDAQLSQDPPVVRAGNGEAFTTVDDSGAQILVPVVTEDGTSVIRTTVSSGTMHPGVARAWASIIGPGAVLLLAAVLVAARLGRRISTPVTDLRLDARGQRRWASPRRA